MTRSYCSQDDVEAYLGVPLPESAVPQCTTMLTAVITYIDRTTRRGWELDPITGEQYVLSRRDVYLRNAPITSVQQVRLRSVLVGDTPAPLTSGTDYELLDPDVGWLHFADGYGFGSILLVDYTPDRPIPSDLSQAAAMIVSHSLYMSAHADRWGIKQAKLDEETVLSYDTGDTQLQVPQFALDIVNGYVKPLWG